MIEKQMTSERQKDIKKLYARLLRLGIPEYLISSDFRCFCIEYDIDNIWNATYAKVRSESKVAILVPGYTGYAKEAFELFLYIIDNNRGSRFKEIIEVLLLNFAIWKQDSVNFEEIRENLIKLGFSEDEIDSIIKKSTNVNAATNSPRKELTRDYPSIGEDGILRSNEVFIVHGHDHGARDKIARVIEKLDLTPVILDDVPSSGRTIIEKIEANRDVGYAIVILTPDDLGRAKHEKVLKTRARQNAILELGYFMSHLGRNRVCVINNGVEELPSDCSGVIYVLLDPDAGWKMKLAKELKEAGFEIDTNKLLS